MTVISELLSSDWRKSSDSVEIDDSPLWREGYLQEAQVLDIRHHALTGVFGVLFELRQSLQFDHADTGVLVGYGATRCEWLSPPRATSLTAWSIESSVPGFANGSFGMRLTMGPSPGARLNLESKRAIFVTGKVVGLEAVPPDYQAVPPDRDVLGIATWSSEFVPSTVASRG